MAKKSTFLLVSLSESQTKDLAQAISNDTCRKILDYLADKEASETDLAKSLGIPISTIHYNLSQLQRGGLVDVENFHYSKKGKEVNHYKLANKYIIIAPRAVSGLKERLSSLLPTIGIVGGLGIVLRYLQSQPQIGLGMAQSAPIATQLVEEAAPLLESATPALRDAVPQAVPAAQEVISQSVSYLPVQDPWVWFIAGALIAIISYLLIDYYSKRR